MNWKKRYTEIKVGDKVRLIKFVSGNIMEETGDIKLGMTFTIKSISPDNEDYYYRAVENHYGFVKEEIEQVSK